MLELNILGAPKDMVDGLGIHVRGLERLEPPLNKVREKSSTPQRLVH